VDVHRENGAPEVVTRKLDDAVEVVLHRHDAPAVVDEGEYPAWYQPFSQAQVAPHRGWDEVVAWALPLYPRGQSLPADLEGKVQRWARLDSPQARLSAALRLVQDEVRYFGREIGDSSHRPSAPADTWERRYGDCKDKAYLLATLLERLDIDAVPALVSMQRGRAIKSYIPSASDFDHVVVRAQIDGGPVWVDATASLQGGDPRNSDLSQFGVALPVEPGRDALQAIEPPLASARGVNVDQTFAPSSEGTETLLAVETTYRGMRADRVRNMLAHTTVEDLSRQWADYYRKLYGQIRVEEPVAVSDDRDANVVVLAEHYVLLQPFIRENTRTWALDVNAENLQAVSALPSSMSRTGPLELGDAPMKFHHGITVRLPEGWSVDASPRNVDVDSSPGLDYSLSVLKDGGAVTLAYDFQLQEDFLEAGKVPGHLAALREVRESLNPRLVFSVPSSIGESERERRLEELVHSVMQQEGGQ
jgi:hypothetical protein